MLTREELINYYEGQLEKVKSVYKINTWSELHNDRNAEVIKFWEDELEKVKNGREW